MEKQNIREYLQKMLDRWNEYDELDGFVAENFRTDLEKTLEYWDLRIEEPIYIYPAGDMIVGSPKESVEEKIYKDFVRYKNAYIKNTWESGIPDDLIEDTLNNVDDYLKSKLKDNK